MACGAFDSHRTHPSAHVVQRDRLAIVAAKALMHGTAPAAEKDLTAAAERLVETAQALVRAPPIRCIPSVSVALTSCLAVEATRRYSGGRHADAHRLAMPSDELGGLPLCGPADVARPVPRRDAAVAGVARRDPPGYGGRCHARMRRRSRCVCHPLLESGTWLASTHARLVAAIVGAMVLRRPVCGPPGAARRVGRPLGAAGRDPPPAHHARTAARPYATELRMHRQNA